MKFTNGYWLTRPEYRMDYASHCVRREEKDGELTLLVACRPVRGRGEAIGCPTLTVRLSAPARNIIRVSVTHFEGAADRPPRFETFVEDTLPVIECGEEHALFTSGSLTARACMAEGGWKLEFLDGNGRVITSSGFRAMAHAVKEEGETASIQKTGPSYMMDSLDLAVGENVYGLGERFTAYVKNGQTVDIWNADGGTASERAYKRLRGVRGGSHRSVLRGGQRKGGAGAVLRARGAADL